MGIDLIIGESTLVCQAPVLAKFQRKPHPPCSGGGFIILVLIFDVNWIFLPPTVLKCSHDEWRIEKVLSFVFIPNSNFSFPVSD